MSDTGGFGPYAGKGSRAFPNLQRAEGSGFRIFDEGSRLRKMGTVSLRKLGDGGVSES